MIIEYFAFLSKYLSKTFANLRSGENIYTNNGIIQTCNISKQNIKKYIFSKWIFFSHLYVSERFDRFNPIHLRKYSLKTHTGTFFYHLLYRQVKVLCFLRLLILRCFYIIVVCVCVTCTSRFCAANDISRIYVLWIYAWNQFPLRRISWILIPLKYYYALEL